MNEENENLFVIKFRNKQKELEKMYQVNILIDGFITKYNSKNKNKYFVFIVYLIKDDISKLNLSEHLISKVSKNTYSIFIDNLNGKEYNLIKLLTMKNDELFKFFLIDELHKNIDISFRFMAYEFSNNETDDLNRNNYRKIMLEKIINNKNIQKYIGICLLQFVNFDLYCSIALFFCDICSVNNEIFLVYSSCFVWNSLFNFSRLFFSVVNSCFNFSISLL